MVHEHIGKIPGRREDSHKGDYGKVMIIAGSIGMTGAACLSSRAAMRAGSGLVTNFIPETLNDIMEIKLTEVMTRPVADTGKGMFSEKAAKDIVEFSKSCDAAVLGPGIGRGDGISKLVIQLLKELECPVVLDADGINAIEGQIEVLSQREYRTVITPHPGEMARLTGKSIQDVTADREGAAKSAAKLSGTVVCLKGHRTVVADPAGALYVNETGNSGMATGGSGDVLTGMIASFIGQGVGDFSASVAAVYLHGMSGDVSSERMGPFSMIASDLIDNLPEAFKRAGI